MKIDKKQIEHLGLLARVGMTKDEKKKYSGQISSILDYVEKLNQVDTDDVKPISQITGLEDVWREDEVHGFEQDVNLIEMAPESDNDMIKTKTVFN